MDVDRPRLTREVGPPDVLEQAVAGEDDAGIAGEGGEEVELPGPELEAAVAHGRLAAAGIDAEVADLHGAAASRGDLGPAEDRPDPGDEGARVERLRHVVVRPELEPDDRVDVVVPRREHEDGRVAAAADLAADLEAVDLRQHEVEDHEVGVVAGVEGEGGLSVARAHDDEALLLEVQAQQVDDVPLVVDDEDRLHPRRRIASAPSTSGPVRKAHVRRQLGRRSRNATNGTCRRDAGARLNAGIGDRRCLSPGRP